MLKFRAINDFQGIRKGQVWELEETQSGVNTPLHIGFMHVCTMVREIDKIKSHIELWEDELEENFEWVKE